MNRKFTGFETATRAIFAGEAEARGLWIMLLDEVDNEVKPEPWEGPGTYQCVQYKDGRRVLVRTPSGRSLPSPSRSTA